MGEIEAPPTGGKQIDEKTCRDASSDIHIDTDYVHPHDDGADLLR